MAHKRGTAHYKDEAELLKHFGPAARKLNEKSFGQKKEERNFEEQWQELEHVLLTTRDTKEWWGALGKLEKILGDQKRS